ncbi:MAG: helix-turn-helix domain-containing protein [Candidatus Nitrosocosmicus sp.]
MVLTKKQKKEMVIRLYEEGKTTKEIAKIVKMSLRDIGIILREYNHEPEPKPPKSDHSNAFQLFSKGKDLIEVSIALDLPFDHVRQYFIEYLDLKGMFDFVNVLKNYPSFIRFFVQIADKMKYEGLFKEDINFLVASLAVPISIRHRKEALEYEVKLLESKKTSLIEENTRLEENNNKVRLSHHPNRFRCLSKDF